jgi:S1-C subfamily serine protease
VNLQILHPLHLGDSSDLQVGQRVYAIGKYCALTWMCCTSHSIWTNNNSPDSPAVNNPSVHRQAQTCLLVYAGNPFGLDHTLTTGVISGTQREIISGINGRPIQGVIQIDAAINVGLMVE